MDFYIETFGCKANQADSASLERDLRARGFAPVPDPSRARLLIVNTCTVTACADQQARQRVRHLRRLNPRALVVVTGCYAEREPRALASMSEVDRVWGNRDKPRLAGLLAGEAFCSRLEPGEEDGQGAESVAAPAAHGRTRAFLKVQDGCDLRCSYCVIPAVRGAGRSVPAPLVRRQIEALASEGYREIVLTGIHTGSWGRDLVPRRTLVDLLLALRGAPGLGRLRLNSLEPLTVSGSLVDLIAAEGWIAPHLQVPLQSGSDRVLRRMRRPYRLSAYARVVEGVRRRLPGAALGADVIAGFPGETEEDFRATLEYVESSPLTYLHVFPYSPRPGTPAALLGERVHGAIVRERARRLREAGERLAERFRASQLGRRLEFLTLDGPSGGTGRLRALSGNYLEADLEWPGGSPNRFVEAEVTGTGPHGPVRARAMREVEVGFPPARGAGPAGEAPVPPPARAGRLPVVTA